MSKPTIQRLTDQHPIGTTITWKAGDIGWHMSKFTEPTVLVSGDVGPKPITFDVSFNGTDWETIRDADGDAFQVRRAGVYKLPVPVAYLRPAIHGAATVQTFIWG